MGASDRIQMQRSWNLTSAIVGNWSWIASSSDGVKLAAVVNGGGIYTSSNSGVTWNLTSAPNPNGWSCIACSQDGVKLVACSRGGGYQIYTSSNSGLTWTQQTGANVPQNIDWESITSSSNGVILAAGSSNGGIYISSDSGVTWSQPITWLGGVWRPMASSTDGTKLVTALSSTGRIHTSSDSGVTWIERTSSPYALWTSIASSSDGTKLAATAGPPSTVGNGFYTSSDSGVTWVRQPSAPDALCRSIISSADGTNLAAVIYGGGIYTSSDSGVTWVQQTSAPTANWQSITSSADGTKLSAVVYGGGIYTSIFIVPPPPPPPPPPIPLPIIVSSICDTNGSGVAGRNQRTLDLDILTYQNMYIKAQTSEQITSYTIPVIPPGSNIYKAFQYFTPQQVLSAANLNFTPSTIPNISTSISSLGAYLSTINRGLSTVSTAIGNNVSSIASTNIVILSTVQGTTFDANYNTLNANYAILQGQNNNILSLQGAIFGLANSLSSISSLFQPNFSTLSNTLNVTFNQGPAVSTLSTFFTNYYSSVSTNIVQFSTNVGSSLSSIVSLDASTMIGYNIMLQSTIQARGGPGVSTLSTIIFSTLSTYTNKITQYNPTSGICSISSYVTGAISTLSSLYILQSGIPGICSISTTLSRTYLINLSTARTLAGTPGLCTMSTYLQGIKGDMSTNFAYAQGNRISTLSTTLGGITTLISSQFTTSGYSYIILQQNDVRNSLSTLSTTIQTTFISTNAAFSTYSLSSFQTISTQFFSSLSNLTSSYIGTSSAISTILYSNLSSPTFSTFTASSIFTQNLTIQMGLNLSSLGIQTPAGGNFPLAIKGGLQILNASEPSVNHILIGNSTIYTNSSVSSYVSSPISLNANDIAYNGSMWVAVGGAITGSPIKYTTNPLSGWSNATGTGLNTEIINSVKWSGSYWLAGTKQTGKIWTSSDGIQWTNITSIASLANINTIGWNGYKWAAVGSDALTNSTIMQADSSAIAWNAANNGFTIAGNGIATNGLMWVAVGSGTSSIKYSYDAMTWNDVMPQLSVASCVAWNGGKFVAGGSNGNALNLMYSVTGVEWTYATSPSPISSITSILWDGSLWNAIGYTNNVSGPNTCIRSPDGISWTTQNTGLTLSSIKGIGYASNTTPCISLSNLDIFSSEMPASMNSKNRMNVIQSTIYFNDGMLTIRPQLAPNQNLGNIGINTTGPRYALDIGVGDARKPSGIDWINPSDSRVKTNIVSADLASCAKLVLDIPLHIYNYTKQFQERCRLDAGLQYGFIAQEVKEILPNSVSSRDEYGFSNFHSLNTDQIFKLEFGATQYLLNAVQTLESQISSIEARIKQ
jgi:hypothetical protein